VTLDMLGIDLLLEAAEEALIAAVERAGSHLKLPEESGAYIILNTANGRMYAGQSGDIKRRCTLHMTWLRTGRHDNKQMSEDFKKHGAAAFKFSAVHLCEGDRLNDVERALISATRQSGTYNISPGVGGWGTTSTERAAETRARRKALGMQRVEVYAHPEDHEPIKVLAAKLQRKRERTKAKEK
jgi:group I intron endonuclease